MDTDNNEGSESTDNEVVIPSEGFSIHEATDFLEKKQEKRDKEAGEDEDLEDEDDGQSGEESIKNKDEEEPDNDESEDSDDSDEDEDSDEDSSDEDGDDEDDDSDDAVFMYRDPDTGEDVPVDAKEAEKGYLRHKDYTQKRMADAKEASETQVLKKELTEQTTQVAKALDQLVIAANTDLKEFQGIDWVALEKEDPYEYEAAARKYDAALRQGKAAAEHRDAVVKQLEEEYKTEFESAKAEEHIKLVSLAPEFDVNVGGVKYREDLNSFAVKQYDFPLESVSSLLDHKALLVLKDAKAFHELDNRVKTGKKNLKKTTTIRPKKGKVGNTTKTRKKNSLKAKMQQTNTIEDALNFLEGSTGN